MQSRQTNYMSTIIDNNKIVDAKAICSAKRLKSRYETLESQLGELEKLNRQVLLVQRICKTQLQQEPAQLQPPIPNEHHLCKCIGKLNPWMPTA